MTAISGLGGSANDIRSNYLNLLVAQLQNQNPLEPMDNNAMASQLAQLSELEQLEGMGQTFQGVLLATQRQQGAALIGKEVSFIPEGADEAISGRVEKVSMADGEVRLHVGSHLIGLDDIQTISN